VLLGGVAAGLVFLSVYLLTCAVSTLTGSPLLLAILLAVGIDLGLVACEVAEMITDDKTVRRWSRCYMLMATIMSMVLSSYEFAAHAPDNWFSKALSVAWHALHQYRADMKGKWRECRGQKRDTFPACSLHQLNLEGRVPANFFLSNEGDNRATR
jgi:hypothetical protein